MKTSVNVPAADDGGAMATAISSSGCSRLDAGQVPVIGHVMESMPVPCCDIIADEQVSSPGHTTHPSVAKHQLSLSVVISRLLYKFSLRSSCAWTANH